MKCWTTKNLMSRPPLCAPFSAELLFVWLGKLMEITWQWNIPTAFSFCVFFLCPLTCRLSVSQILNITKASPQYQDQRLVRQPVDITFTVKGPNGYLLGSEVSNALLELTTVEFSYYMGFPVQQIAERESWKVNFGTYERRSKLNWIQSLTCVGFFFFLSNQLFITRSWTPVRCFAPPGSEQVGSSSSPSAPAAAWFRMFASF